MKKLTRDEKDILLCALEMFATTENTLEKKDVQDIKSLVKKLHLKGEYLFAVLDDLDLEEDLEEE
jgi:hypothetical protein